MLRTYKYLHKQEETKMRKNKMWKMMTAAAACAERYGSGGGLCGRKIQRDGDGNVYSAIGRLPAVVAATNGGASSDRRWGTRKADCPAVECR